MTKLRITVITSILALAGSATAGLYYPANAPSCSTYPDGHGYCYGDMMGFRNNSGPSDYLDVYTNVIAPINGFVSASYSGRSYSCYVPLASNPAFLQTYLGDWNYLYVTWDTGGRCTMLYFDRVSFRPFAQ